MLQFTITIIDRPGTGPEIQFGTSKVAEASDDERRIAGLLHHRLAQAIRAALEEQGLSVSGEVRDR